MEGKIEAKQEDNGVVLPQVGRVPYEVRIVRMIGETRAWKWVLWHEGMAECAIVEVFSHGQNPGYTMTWDEPSKYYP